MQYVGRMYRPPSEADSLILQATVGCSWNRCTYCAMYSDKPEFYEKPLAENLAFLKAAARQLGPHVRKLFVADGDALCMPTESWLAILGAARELFPKLRRVSCYAMARNINEKSAEELAALREAGLRLLYIGPESGDEVTLKRISKGDGFEAHVEAGRKARAAGMQQSVIFLLGAGGVERSREHAEGSADLVTAMDPEFVSALTLTLIPGTTQARRAERGRFQLPEIEGFLAELRTLVDRARPTAAIFRSNHASNYLPIQGRLPRDRERIVEVLDRALAGQIPLRQEWMRGL